MKKILSFIVIAILSTGILSGCADGNNAKEKSNLENQIADLEQEIADLKNNPETPEEAPAGSDSEAAGKTDGTFSPSVSLSDLKKAVSDAVSKADKASPTGSAANQTEQYLEFKAELEQAENMLDIHEDELETAYRSGEINKETYRNEDRELEALEQQLERAEDSLEVLFRMDD